MGFSKGLVARHSQGLRGLAVFMTGFAAAGAGAQGTQVLVEAETFKDRGGWVVDNQFMNIMGSPFLMAHGMGIPVRDAATPVTLPSAGTWKIWARTRDWAPYPIGPGKFQVLVDGKAVGAVQGADGNKAWAWRAVGAFEATAAPAGAAPNIQLALRDQTGFNGRVDALLFTAPAAPAPPEDIKDLTPWRKALLGMPNAPKDGGSYDLVVVGGGIAGITAAVQAQRLGLKVALVHNRPVLGGNNSSETRVHLEGRINQAPYANLGNIVRELDPGPVDNADIESKFIDERKLKFVQSEGVHLFLNHHVFRTETAGGALKAVIAMKVHTNEEFRFAGSWFVDCTGDGEVGFLSGADWRMGRESRAETGEALAPEQPDNESMGYSNLWRSKPTAAATTFPAVPWALQFSAAYHIPMTKADWDWESGFIRNTITEAEEIRDHNLRAIYGNWSWLKNNLSATFGLNQLEWVSYVAGKRESRRLLGDVILKQQDIVGKVPYPDASFTTTWTIDLHYPKPENTKFFPGQEFISIAKHVTISPYPVPYRTLYSRNISNLFMAGRDISVTHVALGTVRVMRTTGMMGEVVGRAASLCKKHGTNPRGVFQNHLPELVTLLKYNGERVVPVGLESGEVDFSDIGRQAVFSVKAGRPGGAELFFRLQSGGKVRLDAYDAVGHFIGTVVDREHGAGEHRVYWSRGRLPPGIYYFRFRAGSLERVGKTSFL